MRTLQFIADCPKHGLIDHPPNECYITQEYVAALLYKQLEQYGFDAQRHKQARGTYLIVLMAMLIPHQLGSLYQTTLVYTI